MVKTNSFMKKVISEKSAFSSANTSFKKALLNNLFHYSSKKIIVVVDRLNLPFLKSILFDEVTYVEVNNFQSFSDFLRRSISTNFHIVFMVEFQWKLQTFGTLSSVFAEINYLLRFSKCTFTIISTTYFFDDMEFLIHYKAITKKKNIFELAEIAPNGIEKKHYFVATTV